MSDTVAALSHSPEAGSGAPAATAPLSGIRVVDLTSLYFGPFASQCMADLGADVVKIEPPEGDVTRQVGPKLEESMSCSYISMNRNKRSLALDLKKEGGREVLARLIRKADVLMHNIRPQKLGKLGLSPEEAMAINPRLVYVSLNGFSESGPYAGRPAFDDIIQGMAGLVDLMERHTGQARYLPTVAADKISGLYAIQAIMAGIIGQRASGRGVVIEVPMFESVTSFTLTEHMFGRQFEPPKGSMGYSRALSAFRRPFKTADGHVCVMPYTDAHWRGLFSETGHPEMAGDQRFATLDGRVRHTDMLYEMIDAAMITRSTDSWLEAFTRLDIPAGRVNRIEQLEDDPHLRAMRFFHEIDSGVEGTKVRLTVNPVRYDGRTPDMTMPPRLGENTIDILAEAGFSSDEIDRFLRDRSAVQHAAAGRGR